MADVAGSRAGSPGLGVLITQCLQNDFVKPLAPYTPLPNLLHVGHEEARRLMGDDPAEVFQDGATSSYGGSSARARKARAISLP